MASCSALAALSPSEQADVAFVAAGLKGAPQETIDKRLAALAPGRYADALREVIRRDRSFR